MTDKVEVITAMEACKILKENGIHMSPDTLRLALKQKVFPWGWTIVDEKDGQYYSGGNHQVPNDEMDSGDENVMTLCKKCCKELDMIPVRKCGQVKCRNCGKRRWSYWCVIPYSKRRNNNEKDVLDNELIPDADGDDY